jgi:hypothetical protein
MTKFVAALIGGAIVAGATAAYVHAEAEPGGYVGKGQLVVRTDLAGPGSTVTLGGDIAMEERGSRLRVDVLSLAIPGTNATISALIGTQLFPPGGFSIVYDRNNSSFTVWSNAQKKFYSTASVSPAPAPAAPVVPVPGINGDLFGAFAFAKRLKDYNALTVSLGLTGHQTVNGHPASGLEFHVLRTTKDNETTDVHGNVQFADDLDGVPVQISVAGKSKSLPESAFRLDFSSLMRAAPPESDFDAPAGYARSASLGDVIGKSLPITGGL